MTVGKRGKAQVAKTSVVLLLALPLSACHLEIHVRDSVKFLSPDLCVDTNLDVETPLTIDGEASEAGKDVTEPFIPFQ